MKRRPEGVESFRVESVEVEPVQDVEDSFVVVLAREVRDFVEEGDEDRSEAEVEPVHLLLEGLDVDARLQFGGVGRVNSRGRQSLKMNKKKLFSGQKSTNKK